MPADNARRRGSRTIDTGQEAGRRKDAGRIPQRVKQCCIMLFAPIAVRHLIRAKSAIARERRRSCRKNRQSRRRKNWNAAGSMPGGKPGLQRYGRQRRSISRRRSREEIRREVL